MNVIHLGYLARLIMKIVRRKNLRNSAHLTYLAGPMHFIRRSGAGWRVFFAKLLEKYRISVQDPVKTESKKTGLSPRRTKELLMTLSALTIQGDKEAEKKFKKISKRMVETDLKMVRRSIFIIAQVIEGVVSVGTTVEIIFAAICGIPVYVIYSGRPAYFSPWLLYLVLLSGGKIFQEKKRNGFKECLAFLRNKFELEELEHKNGRILRIKKFKERNHKAKK